MTTESGGAGGRPPGRGRGRPGAGPRAERRPDDEAAAWTDAELVARVREDDRRAFVELYRRFEPMLRGLALQARVPAEDAGSVAADALSHVAMRLRDDTGPGPSRLAAYLARTLYALVSGQARGELRRRQRQSEAAEPVAGVPALAEWAVRETSSEYAVRACLGPGAEAARGLTPGLRRLSAALDAALSDDERQALRMLGDGVPQREIAVALGITHGAVRTRIARLRQRLVRAALAYASTAPPADAAEVRRLLRRAGVLDLGARQSPPDAHPPSSPLTSHPPHRAAKETPR